MLVPEHEIATAVGKYHLRRLQFAFPGERIYIPAKYNPENPACKALGEQAAKLLVNELGGNEVHISTSAIVRERNLCITAMRLAGLPASQIGKLIGLKARTIRKIVQGLEFQQARTGFYGARARRLRWFEQYGRTQCQESTPAQPWPRKSSS